MKIVHLSSCDLEGGAAKAACRLHVSLAAAGVDSKMLVRRRRSKRADIARPGGRFMRLWLRLQRRGDRLVLVANGGGSADFSPGLVPDGLVRAIRALKPDVVHLHWIADGFFQIKSLPKIAVPIVWTMHDMWPFTGGCHYVGSCRAFTETCGFCPLLNRPREFDLARRGWERRRAAFAGHMPVFVAPSRWMGEQAQGSALLRNADIRVIPYGIDTTCFAPADHGAARARFSLPPDKLVLLAGAAQLTDNPRKGYAHFLTALKTLRTLVPAGTVEIALFGSAGGLPSEHEGFRIHNLGVLHGDEVLASAYASADVFIAPSLEDNLPNMLIEAMAVGTPVVAYNSGGIPDIVDDGENGLLAASGDPEALGCSIARMLNEHGFRRECGQRARAKVLRSFDSSTAVDRHLKLYEGLQAQS